MDWLDISVPIHPWMPIFEGDPRVHIERVAAISEGAVCNVSRLDLGAHSGTHIDAPVHFIDGAAGAETTPLDAVIGPAFVVDAADPSGAIDESALERLSIPAGAERLLFKTSNSYLWDEPRFSPEYVAFTEAAARALASRRVRLVGIDYLSVAPFGDPAPVHRALLEAGVVILEGLDLRAVAPGAYELLCLPLRIVGCDGGPARALLRPR